MNCSPTLTADEFKTLHNALCDLRSIAQTMNHSLVKLERVESVISQFEDALRGAYEQDNSAFSTKSDHYDEIRQVSGLKSIWSIYEVEELGDQHKFGDRVVQLAYHDHWGDNGPVFVEVKGGTWVDLYEAADEAIRKSGDNHHVFIEGFRVNPECPDQLILSTGS